MAKGLNTPKEPRTAPAVAPVDRRWVSPSKAQAMRRRELAQAIRQARTA